MVLPWEVKHLGGSLNWEQESGGTRVPGCEHARQGDQLPDSLPWRGKRGDAPFYLDADAWHNLLQIRFLMT